MKIEFRKAESQEFASALIQQNMHTYYEKRNIHWDTEHFNKSWEEFENVEVFVESKRIGLLRFSFGDSNCYIRDLQIETRYQGRGYGSRCLKYALSVANARNDKFIKLRVFSENPAIEMYRKYGFKQVSELNDLIEMALDLNEVNELDVSSSPLATCGNTEISD